MKMLPFAQWPAWGRANKTLIAACILSGGEAMVAAGIPLPGAEYIPPQARGLAIAALGGFALYFRIRASSGGKRG